MAFVKGKSGNPAGRPPKAGNKIPSNVALRNSLKKSCPEALNATVAYMREYRCDANTARNEANRILTLLLTTSDPIEKEELTNELRVAISNKDKAFDKTLKASFKLMDATYTMVAAEDRIEVTKKANASDEDEYDSDSSPAPIMQLTAVKT